MRNIYLSLIALFLLTASDGHAQENIVGNLEVIHAQVERTGDRLQVNFTLDGSGLEIRPNDQLKIQPVLIRRQDTVRLPYILLPGTIRDKMNRRMARLYDEETLFSDPYLTVVQDKYRNPVVDYRQSLPFEDWMYGSRLELMQEVYGCPGCYKKLAVVALDRLAPVYAPRAMFIVPEAEAVKKREEQVTAYIHFVVARYEIQPDFDNNAAELAKMDRLTENILHDKNTAPTAIRLTGYASPEGTYAYNTRLSQNRTEATKNYIADKFHPDPSLFITHSVPEDWEGVRRWVEASDIPYRTQVLDIIAHTENPDARDAEIRALDGGATYRMLLHDVYPSLRRVDYKIDYTVVPFTVEEGKRILDTKPRQLSLNELYLIAQTYPKGSPEFNRVFQTASELFPDDPVANNNMAAVALEQGNLQAARAYLERIRNNPIAFNNLGVLLVKEGRVREAIPYFQKARAAGSAEAAYNLQDIESKE